MKAKRLVGSVAVVLGAAALWGLPITGAQARGYHPNPHHQSPAPPDDGPDTRGQESDGQRAGRESDTGTPEGCFRRYEERCQRGREHRRGHGDVPTH